MNNSFGAFPLTADAFGALKVGMWAIELDPGLPPRMYADDSMRALLGIEAPMTPEETYRAWYDRVDPGSYGLIAQTIEQMKAGVRAEAVYPWHHPRGNTVTVRCGGTRNLNYTKGLRVEGAHQDVTGVMRFDTAENERRQREELSRQLFILTDEFESIYEVELETGAYTLFVNNKTLYNSMSRELVGGGDFFADTAVNIPSVVYPFDREDMLKVCSREYFIGALSGGEAFDRYYRTLYGGKTTWYKIRVAYADASRSRVIVGVFNAEKEMAAAQARVAASENAAAAAKGREVIEAFTDRYLSVYRLNIRDGSYAVLKIRGEEQLSPRHLSDWEREVRLYVNSRVYEADRETALRELSLAEIAAEAGQSGGHSAVFRIVKDGVPLWHRMRVRAMNKEEVLVGFSQDDTDIITELINTRLHEHYEAIYLLDFSRDQLRVIKASGYMLEKPRIMPYTAMLRHFAAGLTGEAKAHFEAVADIDTARARLNIDGRTDFTYQSPYFEGGPVWISEETLVLTRKDGLPETAVCLIKMADTLQRERLALEAQVEQQNRQLEQSLTVSRYFLGTFISAYYIDLTDGSYVIMHQSEELSGSYPAEATMYSSFSRYIDTDVHPEDREALHRINGPDFLRACIKDGGTYSHTYRDISEGTEKYYRVLIIPGSDSDHAGFGFTDVTADIQKEKALESANNNLQFLTDSTRQLYPLIAVMRLTSNRFYMLEYENFPVRGNTLKGTADEFIASAMRCLPVDGQRSAFAGQFSREALIAAYKDGRRVLSQRLQMSDKSGALRWVNATAVVSFIDSKYYCIFLARIIDDEVEAELKYQAALEKALADAERAINAKTEFLFNMSHDIRTPMNAIMGFTDIALKHIDDTSRVQDSLGKTRASGELLLSLINDILDMSRIESGKISLTEAPCDIYEVFSGIESTMQELAYTKRIALSFSVSNIASRYVYLDDVHCARIFVNIIGNAVKYTPEGGKVTAACEQIDTRDGRGIYRFTFEDNGIGISEEFLPRVFDEFSREKNATVSGIQGTGLGLSVCRSFVNAMGGTITCRSTPGKGSVFTVTLPFKLQSADAPRAGGAPETAEAPGPGFDALSGRRALLVDDNELNLEIAKCILTEEGLEVETARDGSEAVELLSQKGPDYYDLVLMDIQMPVMDGYEAARRILAMYPDAGIPIIALSANAFAEDKAASLRAGMVDHVAKPINIARLNDVMARYCRDRKR